MIDNGHINFYEGLYDATDDGTVLNSITWRALKWWTVNWYKYVWLWKDWTVKNLYVHRLVAQRFLPNPNNYRVVHHIDGNKQNNKLCNLHWCTHSENTRRAYEDWLRMPSEKQRVAARKTWLMTGKINFIDKSKKVMQLTKDGILCRIYKSCSEAWRVYDINPSAISQCASWKRKMSCWYFWKYV